MERLKQDLKNQQFQRVYLLYGSEQYLIKYYKKRLKDAIIGDDTMNYTFYQGQSVPASEIIDIGNTMPFFAEKRLIILEDTDIFKSGAEEISDYIKSMPEYLYIIIIEPAADKRTKLFKTVNSVGSAVEIKAYTGDEQLRWINGMLARDSKKMTINDMHYLISLTGDDMVNISSEIEKLISYTGDREIVSRADIDAIVSRQIGDHIFKMVEAMGNRNQTKALEYYYDLLAKREPPFKILALVTRQFNLILQAKELKQKRLLDKDIASKIGVNPYFVKDYINQGNSFEIETLIKALEACARADEDIKTGKMSDKLSVELLIVEFSK